MREIDTVAAAARRTVRRRRALPRLKRNAPAVTRGRYREQFGVVIICPDAATQAGLYRALTALPLCGLRVVVT
jgi:hypothetical protein